MPPDAEWLGDLVSNWVASSERSTYVAVDDHNLIWVDLEMTGLIPEQDRVIEIATIVTDTNLTVLAEGPVIAIRQTPAVLASMDEWNTRTHTRS